MQVVVLAGGLGTRLRPMTDHMPKPMVAVGGRPFLDHLLSLLRRQSVRDIVLCVGHLGDQIRRHYGDGRRFGVDIRYSDEGEQLLGTAGAVLKARALLADEFFLTYGDSYLAVDFSAITDWFHRRDRLGAMVVYRNRDRLDRSNVIVDGDLVGVYDKGGRTPGMEYINFGVSLLRRDALRFVPEGTPFSQEEWYGQLVERGELLAYETADRFYEIGSHSGLDEFRRLMAAGALP